MPAFIDIITKGSTDQGLTLRMADSGDGTPETGVTSATSGLDVWYRRQGGLKVSLTESDLSALNDAHSDGGLLHISDGEYRVDFPDAAFASGADYVDVGWGATSMVGFGGRVRLIAANLEDSVRLGLTALPNAAADGAGGLPVSDAGGLDLDTLLGYLTAAVATASALSTAQSDLDTLTGSDGVTLATSQPNYAPAVAGDNMGTVSAVTGGINTGAGTITTLDGLGTAQDSQHSTTQSAISALSIPSAASVADAVLDEALSGHTTAGTLGKAVADIEVDTNELQGDLTNGGRLDLILDELTTQGDTNETAIGAISVPSAASVADAVLDEALSGHATAGTLGKAITDIEADTNELQGDWTNGGRLDLILDGIASDNPGRATKGVELANLMFTLIDSTDDVSPVTGVTVTAQISKDGGAFASCTNSVTEVSNGWYKITLTSTEMNADTVALRFSGSGANDRAITVLTQPT